MSGNGSGWTRRNGGRQAKAFSQALCEGLQVEKENLAR